MTREPSLFAPPASAQPLAARMRPRSLDDFLGQEQLLGPGKALGEYLAGGQTDRRSGGQSDALTAGPPDRLSATALTAGPPDRLTVGYGKDYRYAHAVAEGYTAQEYLPAVLRGARFFEPTEFGFEREIAKRIAWWEKLKRRAAEGEGTAEP